MNNIHDLTRTLALMLLSAEELNVTPEALAGAIGQFEIETNLSGVSIEKLCQSIINEALRRDNMEY